MIALGVVAAVIFSIVAGITIANYISITQDADEILYNLDSGAIGFLHTELAPSTDAKMPGIESPNQPWEERTPKGLPREISFSARYFIVETDAEGIILSGDLNRIAYVREGDLESFVSDATSDSGYVGDYRYRRTETENGYKYIFLDCEQELAACRTFVLSAVVITFVGMFIISLLIVFLSKKALRPVEESYEKQKRFITDAGHELKTPLTVIGANAELLELDIGENEWLESIKGQVKKLNKLTKELVFLSRMDEENRELMKAPFSLKNAMEEVANGLKEAALIANKEISLEAEEVSVNANEEMVRRVLGLLLDNAIKYAENPEISVTLRKEGKYAVIEERNAASLAKGEHSEPFERFYRPDASRTNETGGHGIGLSVVKSVVEAHKGTVSCVSDGEKVTFRLAFPMA